MQIANLAHDKNPSDTLFEQTLETCDQLTDA
jgi:hypothetical protein